MLHVYSCNINFKDFLNTVFLNIFLSSFVDSDVVDRSSLDPAVICYVLLKYSVYKE